MIDQPTHPSSAPPLDATPARALGEFIRTHRERLTPAEVGLPPGPRRRTPGLRREEVAQLCGVSPTWYTWIEQGRPVSASADALARIAVPLRLSRAERAYPSSEGCADAGAARCAADRRLRRVRAFLGVAGSLRARRRPAGVRSSVARTHRLRSNHVQAGAARRPEARRADRRRARCARRCR